MTEINDVPLTVSGDDSIPDDEYHVTVTYEDPDGNEHDTRIVLHEGTAVQELRALAQNGTINQARDIDMVAQLLQFLHEQGESSVIELMKEMEKSK